MKYSVGIYVSSRRQEKYLTASVSDRSLSVVVLRSVHTICLWFVPLGFYDKFGESCAILYFIYTCGLAACHSERERERRTPRTHMLSLSIRDNHTHTHTSILHRTASVVNTIVCLYRHNFRVGRGRQCTFDAAHSHTFRTYTRYAHRSLRKRGEARKNDKTMKSVVTRVVSS